MKARLCNWIIVNHLAFIVCQCLLGFTVISWRVAEVNGPPLLYSLKLTRIIFLDLWSVLWWISCFFIDVSDRYGPKNCFSLIRYSTLYASVTAVMNDISRKLIQRSDSCCRDEVDVELDRSFGSSAGVEDHFPCHISHTCCGYPSRRTQPTGWISMVCTTGTMPSESKQPIRCSSTCTFCSCCPTSLTS